MNDFYANQEDLVEVGLAGCSNRLFFKQDLSKSAMAIARNGKALSLIVVFSHAMKYFKDAAINHCSLLSEKDVDLQHITWVITVPAIWNDGAKQIMREAAYKVNSVRFFSPLFNPKNRLVCHRQRIQREW